MPYMLYCTLLSRQQRFFVHWLSSVIAAGIDVFGEALPQESPRLPIGLHSGLVWGYYIINVGQLVEYSGQVPD